MGSKKDFTKKTVLLPGNNSKDNDSCSKEYAVGTAIFYELWDDIDSSEEANIDGDDGCDMGESVELNDVDGNEGASAKLEVIDVEQDNMESNDQIEIICKDALRSKINSNANNSPIEEKECSKKSSRISEKVTLVNKTRQEPKTDVKQLQRIKKTREVKESQVPKI